MNDLSFHIHTIGCKTNLCESDDIARRLIKQDCVPVPLDSNPSYIIINSCTVTSAADKKVRQYIRRARTFNPGSEIIVTGCGTAFNEQVFKNLGASSVIYNSRKEDIPDLISARTSGSADKKGTPSFMDFNSDAGKSLPEISKDGEDFYLHSRALVKIQDGCEQNCSYCIVPFVRGSYKSTPENVVIERLLNFEADGFEEVVFTGIHIGRYGADFRKESYITEDIFKNCKNVKTNLANLLRITLEKTSIKRIRLSSIEINEIDSDLIQAIQSGGSRVAPHLHIPLQSGSEKILKSMKRKYSCQFFLKRIQALKNEIPGLVITTDIIAGFPGESDEDFQDTLSTMMEAGFAKTHVFKYSVRNNTAASAMDGQIDERLKSQRSKKARDLGEELREEYLRNFTGKTLKVVCEAYDTGNGIAYGTSENYLKVYFKMHSKDYIRKKCKIINVKAEKKYLDGLYGVLVF
ncbi:MAG: tRNA (N(6)-L-threonylcarbamoyladenosine(37)-C(2))-methylthiotransferase MtaB [Actinobacteria bacterium]|nr:tRNA (N(6)-L-threonylcarbamoyladenosine(37)-C(2))-methylthiotransferase MtaB [Actinomycetota bacterium]